MAAPLRRLEESVPPLISSLVTSVERLPDLTELGTPEPVLAKNRKPLLANFIVPAVCFRVGTRTIAVFPLHREAIGDMWDTDSLIAEWDFEVLPRVWSQALATFRTHIDYPIEFLQLFLTTLREGHFLDNTVITASTWRDACRSPSDLLVVQSLCFQCSSLRSFASRTLLTAPAVFPRWICSHFGLECYSSDDHPIFSIAPDQWLAGVKPISTSSTPKPADEPQLFPLDALAIPSSTVVSNPQQRPAVSSANPQQFAIATPLAEPDALPVDTLTPTAFADSVSSMGFLTWTQVPPSRRTCDPSVVSLRNPASLRRPAPSHYMVGDPLTFMHEVDPPHAEVEAFSRIFASNQWKQMRKDFDKWITSRKGAHFEGKGSPNEVTNWDNVMSTYFYDNAITNTIIQSRLAAQSFVGQALNWWRSHSQLVPELVISYEQLLEWIRTELVPLADPASATLAWRQLRFLGEVEDYLKQLDQLTVHFPIPQATLLTMATEPLGREVVSSAYKADQMYGKDGMSYVRLRRFIQAHLQQLTPTQRKFLADNPPLAMGYGRSPEKEKKSSSNTFRPNVAPRNRPPHYAQANTVEVEKPLAKVSHPSKRIGKGANPCWVCGSDRHMWYVCEKKKKGTCACCGSMAHITRDCAQRYFPATSSWAGKNSNTSKEQLRSSRSVRKPKQRVSSVESVDDQTEKPLKRSSKTKNKSRSKKPVPSSSSSSSSEDEDSSDTPSSKHRNHHRCSCIVQTAFDDCYSSSALDDQTSLSDNTKSAASVASKAVIDWPNVWSELSSEYPIGSMLQLSPISSPPRSTLLYYQVEVNRMPAVAMFDTGASQSFITYDLADQLQAPLIPLKESLTTIDFGGQKSAISHTVQLSLRLTSIARVWTFYVSKTAPAPIVLGLDLVLEWPLFLNPRDKCLYVPLASSTHNEQSRSSRARCLMHPVVDANSEVKLEIVNDYLDSSSSSSSEIEPSFSQLTFNPDTFTVDCVHRASVTASGFAEAEELSKFIESLPVDFREVVNEFSPLFQPPDRDPPARSVKHYISVPNDVVPAARKAYPMPQHKLLAMREQMRELIDKGWVVASSSPWASPILFVPKDGGTKHRMCIDFRDLNALTKKDRFPLPRIDLLLHRSAKACLFSKIDLASGFHQIEVFPQHRELTAFILPETVDGQSLWEWKVMPFGLVNAPSTF